MFILFAIIFFHAFPNTLFVGLLTVISRPVREALGLAFAVFESIALGAAYLGVNYICTHLPDDIRFVKDEYGYGVSSWFADGAQFVYTYIILTGFILLYAGVNSYIRRQKIKRMIVE
jgi:uncharacterized protein YebE (UPF0316 family)